MIRAATSNELAKPLAQVFADLENSNDSLLIRADGEAVAVVLTGEDFEEYRAWIADQAWGMIEATRAANAHLTTGEIEEIGDRAVHNIRKERRESRAAS